MNREVAERMADAIIAHMEQHPFDNALALRYVPRLYEAGHAGQAERIVMAWARLSRRRRQLRERGRLVFRYAAIAVVLGALGLPLAVAWFLNLGPVHAWHLAGPVLLGAAAGAGWRAWRAAR